MDFFETTDHEKYGLGLTGAGILFSLLGIIFNKGLAVMGNTLLICGVPLIIGLNSTMPLLMKPSNFKGTILFAIGFFLVVIMGWPFWGMIMEGYGFFLLWSGFWPTIAVFILKIIALGPFLLQQFFRMLENIQVLSISADSRVENSMIENSTHVRIENSTHVNENRYNDAVPVIEPSSRKQTDKASGRSLLSKCFKFWGRSKAGGNANLRKQQLAHEQNMLLRVLDQLQAIKDQFSNSEAVVEKIASVEAFVAVAIQKISEQST